MNREITSSDDIIDSRDVIERIDYLEGTEDEDEQHELEMLQELAAQCESYYCWECGEGLIHEGYFTKYAEQLANDICGIDIHCSWPLNHIDWEAAAEELKQDYMNVEFDGATYFIRCY